MAAPQSGSRGAFIGLSRPGINFGRLRTQRELGRTGRDDIVRRANLKATDLFRLAPWTYADTVFARGWDNMISTVKANRFGFTEMIDTQVMMTEVIADFRTRRIIP